MIAPSDKRERHKDIIKISIIIILDPNICCFPFRFFIKNLFIISLIKIALEVRYKEFADWTAANAHIAKIPKKITEYSPIRFIRWGTIDIGSFG